MKKKESYPFEFTIFVNDMKEILRHPSTKQKPYKDFYGTAWTISRTSYSGFSSLGGGGYSIRKG